MHRPLDLHGDPVKLTRLFRPAKPFEWGVAGSGSVPAFSIREGTFTDFLGDPDAQPCPFSSARGFLWGLPSARKSGNQQGGRLSLLDI